SVYIRLIFLFSYFNRISYGTFTVTFSIFLLQPYLRAKLYSWISHFSILTVYPHIHAEQPLSALHKVANRGLLYCSIFLPRNPAATWASFSSVSENFLSPGFPMITTAPTASPAQVMV